MQKRLLIMIIVSIFLFNVPITWSIDWSFEESFITDYSGYNLTAEYFCTNVTGTYACYDLNNLVSFWNESGTTIFPDDNTTVRLNDVDSDFYEIGYRTVGALGRIPMVQGRVGELYNVTPMDAGLFIVASEKSVGPGFEANHSYFYLVNSDSTKILNLDYDPDEQTSRWGGNVDNMTFNFKIQSADDIVSEQQIYENTDDRVCTSENGLCNQTSVNYSSYANDSTYLDGVGFDDKYNNGIAVYQNNQLNTSSEFTKVGQSVAFQYPVNGTTQWIVRNTLNDKETGAFFKVENQDGSKYGGTLIFNSKYDGGDAQGNSLGYLADTIMFEGVLTKNMYLLQYNPGTPTNITFSVTGSDSVNYVMKDDGTFIANNVSAENVNATGDICITGGNCLSSVSVGVSEAWLNNSDELYINSSYPQDINVTNVTASECVNIGSGSLCEKDGGGFKFTG